VIPLGSNSDCATKNIVHTEHGVSTNSNTKIGFEMVLLIRIINAGIEGREEYETPHFHHHAAAIWAHSVSLHRLVVFRRLALLIPIIETLLLLYSLISTRFHNTVFYEYEYLSHCLLVSLLELIFCLWPWSV